MIKSLFFAFAALFSITIMAQKWQIGPDFGVNALPVEKNDFGLMVQPAVVGGAFIRFELNEHWSFRSGAYFTQKKHNYTMVDSGQINLFGFEDQIDGLENVDLSTYEYTNGNVSQYYVELPLIAEFNWSNYFAFAGPYLSYQLFARSRIEEISEAPALQVIDLDAIDPDGQFSAFLPEPYTYNFRESASRSGLNDWDAGLRAGIGLKVDRFEFSTAYNFGFLPFRSDDASAAFRTYQYLQMNVAYWFDLGK